VWIALALATLAQASGAATTGGVVQMAVSQGHARLPTVTLYLDLLTAAHEPPAHVPADRLKVTIGAHPARVDRLLRFDATGEGVAYVFVVDVSKSISSAQMARIRTALKEWTAGLGAADRAALVTFGDTATVTVDFSDGRDVLASQIDALAPHDDTTRLHVALARALELGRRGDPGLPARRAIVLLSDGRDEGSGLTEDDLTAQIRQDRAPIYAVGYTSRRGSAGAARGLETLHRFSANSGGVFREAGRADLAPFYTEMRQAITRVFVAALTCDACEGDGSLRPVHVSLDADGRVLSSSTELRVPPGPPTSSPAAARVPAPIASPEPAAPWWIWVTPIVVAIAAALGFVAWRRGRAASPPDALDPEATVKDLPAAPPRTRVTFHFRGTDAPTRSFDVESPITIGAGAGCALALVDDPDVAPEHGQLFVDHGRLVLRPLDPERTTLVNGVPVRSRIVLESGDLVLVGRTEMRVTFELGVAGADGAGVAP
jgi:hypothetical protein